MGNSTISLQSVVDDALTYPELKPVLNVAGFSLQPALNIANTVIQFMLSQRFPWKWSQITLPVFYSNSWQQDYAVLGVTTLAWLTAGNVMDVNNTQVPKPRLQVEVDRSLPETSASLVGPSIFGGPKFFVNWLPNDQLYYGTWGSNSSTGTSGNNPVSGSVYTNPVASGKPQPANPITQIIDANGNLLVLTGYGTEGTTAPVAPASSAAGTVATPGSGATTAWTVVDPKGQGFRVLPIPGQTGNVWQFNLFGQQRPTLFTSFAQMLDPVPDDYSDLFRQGFVTYCYKRSPETKIRLKFDVEYKLWLAALEDARMKSDRERDSASFEAESIVSPLGSGWRPNTPGYPFAY